MVDSRSPGWDLLLYRVRHGVGSEPGKRWRVDMLRRLQDGNIRPQGAPQRGDERLVSGRVPEWTSVDIECRKATARDEDADRSAGAVQFPGDPRADGFALRNRGSNQWHARQVQARRALRPVLRQIATPV